jgi:hypothetical protein
MINLGSCVHIAPYLHRRSCHMLFCNSPEAVEGLTQSSTVDISPCFTRASPKAWLTTRHCLM